MTAITVAPDRQWLIQESRLRFAVDAGVTREMVPITILKDVLQAISIMEKLRHYKHIDTMPTHIPKIQKPCCTQIATARPGQPIKVIIEPSALQGDTDDIHNSGEATYGEERLYIDNKIDWVAIVHFWAPALNVNLEQLKEELPRESQGFVSPELLPKELLAASKRYANV